MSIITISNDNGVRSFVPEDFTHEEIEGGVYELLNTREIGIEIAHQFFFEGEDVSQFDLDVVIDEYLAGIHEKIITTTTQVLEENGIQVE